MENRVPRVIISGTNSNCGKTTVACGVLQALTNRKLSVGAFKCGPDYIDTMFHSRIIGTKSSNLDLVFFTKNVLKNLLVKNGAGHDINIIEGVMGFYDGWSLTSAKASTYEISECTRTPVILVVGAKGAALSVLATIQGFLDLYPDNMIRGVILNQCTQMTYASLEKAIEERFGGKVRPLGFMPNMPDCAFESRHLGLITADEVENLKEKMEMLAEQVEKSVDLDSILKMAADAAPVFYDQIPVPRMGEPFRIAVAKDKAFCFYYDDNLDLLREMGAELVPFSPISDEKLPENIQGLYLGGGYPELYAEDLSRNETMRRSVKTALEGKLPCIAECGGFMYLTESIKEHEMVGALPGTCYDNGRLTRFGYVTITAKKDNLMCRAGESIKAHEFHHWDVTDTGSGFVAEKASGKTWDCVASTDSLYAGYPHFHFYSNLNFAENFCKACISYKGEHTND